MRLVPVQRQFIVRCQILGGSENPMKSPESVEKKSIWFLRLDNLNMIQYFHPRSILAFQLALVDVFRAQIHLPTPSGHQDMCCQSRKSSIFERKIQYFPMFRTYGFHQHFD